MRKFKKLIQSLMCLLQLPAKQVAGGVKKDLASIDPSK